MESMNVGQLIFSPSRNPYRSLPRFVRNWAVTDLVFSSVWCALSLLFIAWMIVMLAKNVPGWWHMIPSISLAATIGGLGLGANITLLCRRPGAMIVAKLLIFFSFLSLLWHGYETGVLMCNGGLMNFLAAGGLLLFLLARITLLFFYCTALIRAGRFFRARRQALGF